MKATQQLAVLSCGAVYYAVQGGYKPGGYSVKLYTGRLRPEVQTLTLYREIIQMKAIEQYYILYCYKYQDLLVYRSDELHSPLVSG